MIYTLILNNLSEELHRNTKKWKSMNSLCTVNSIKDRPKNVTKYVNLEVRTLF